MTTEALTTQMPLVTEPTAADVQAALLRRYYPQGQEWALIFELPVGTGFAPQRIDAFAINLYPSHDFKRIAFEIKISRGDYLRELKDKAKRRRALMFSNQFYFVAPAGMLKPSEIPVECGLMEVETTGEIRIALPAPHRDSLPPSWHFLAAFARLAARQG